MRKILIIYFLFYFTSIFLSCKKDIEDGRGVTISDTYLVIDTIVDPFQTVFIDTFEINISYNSSTPNDLLISNYGNIINSQQTPIEVEAQVNGSTLNIPAQLIIGPSNIATTDYIQVNQSIGYYANDSIYFHLSYSDRHDPYYGDCWGSKD